MPLYRNSLPQLSDKLFLSDGGLETTLIFHDGIELPHFASFVLLGEPDGLVRLRAYYARYALMARDAGLGFVLETPTWRASADWGYRLGLSEADLDRLNRKAVDLMVDVRRHFATKASPMVISGNIGPRGDGYRAETRMTADEAQIYHTRQIRTFARTKADMVAAFTLNYIEEAIGITRAAQDEGIPVAISFTLETDGKLPTGQTLREAIMAVDAATTSGPAYYMINCAHPSHFGSALDGDAPWLTRIRGIRANASTRSHAELDQSTDLDDGDPVDLGRHYAALRRRFGQLTVLGGCCGTDHRHVDQIRRFCASVPEPEAA
jgi:S-methylmethionine-dependent homocysteine/selenocysteine methylase